MREHEHDPSQLPNPHRATSTHRLPLSHPRNHKLITDLNRRTRFCSGKQRPNIINSELRARIECASRLQLHKLYSGIQCSHAEVPAATTATWSRAKWLYDSKISSPRAMVLEARTTKTLFFEPRTNSMATLESVALGSGL